MSAPETSARILDGAAVARTVRAALKPRVADLDRLGRRPGLGVILAGDDPASAVYVASKTKACEEVGIHHETATFPRTVTTAELLAKVEELNRRADIHGILVQLPLPAGVDSRAVLDAIDPRKDVDGFHPTNAGLLVQKRPRFVACTPAGILHLLKVSGVALAGARAAVVGRSDIVGKPMGLLLLHEDATVTYCHSRTKDLAAVTRGADVLVAAIGRAGFIRAEHVKPGAVVVDVGMNRITDLTAASTLLEGARLEAFKAKGSALVGDVDAPSVRRVAGALTPVPGGVGPLTIAFLLSNTVDAAG